MDINTIVDLIGNLGFPIIMCGALCYYIYKQSSANNKAIEQLEDVVTELKSAIQQLISKLEDK